MKVLVLTAKTGGGHNTTAKNVKELLEKNGIEVEIFDILNGYPSLISYDNTIKYIPGIYDLSYKITNNELITILNRVLRSQSIKLLDKINEYKPNAIISAHAMGVSMFKRFKRKNYDINIPYIQIVTDYIPHRVYYDKDVVSAYITGSEYTNFELVKKGIDLIKTYDYGIPVADKFIKEKDTKIKHNVMIMLGSMGFELEIDNIIDLLEENDYLTFHFITGNNEKLKEELENKFKEKIENKKLYVYGFINNVDEIMEKSDIVITKPGGLSITECINMRKPMILLNPIPGQEEENMHVMGIYGIGINGVNKNLVEIIDNIYKYPIELDNMLEGIDRISKNYSKDNIIKLLYKIINFTID